MASAPSKACITSQPTDRDVTVTGTEPLTETGTGYTRPQAGTFRGFSPAFERGVSANAIAEIVLSVLIVTLNGLVVFTIVRPRNKDRLRTPLNLLIMQLAVADLLVGGVGQPLSVYQLVAGITRESVCIVYLTLNMAPFKASLLGFVVISVERFVAIRFPMKYQTIFTNRNSILVWLCVWVFSLFYGLVPVLVGIKQNWNPYVGCSLRAIIPLDYLVWFGALGTYTVECTTIVCIYTYLFVVVHRQMRQIASLRVPSSGPEAEDSLVRKYSRRDLAVGIRCLTMVLAHFICRWPLAINSLLSWQGIVIDRETFYRLVWLARLNSLINPICYAYANTELRRELGTILPCRALRIRLVG